jgi:hypothetical protein
MKKYIFLLLVFLFAWCSKSWWDGDIKEYNNSLMAIQSQSVDIIKNYYEWLEKNYDGSNLLEMFTWTIEELQWLDSKLQFMSWWKGDTELKNAVSNYISWLQMSFITNEWPVVEMLLDYTWQVSHFYRDNESFFSNSAMKFASDLATLDKELESYYVHFSEKYWYNM